MLEKVPLPKAILGILFVKAIAIGFGLKAVPTLAVESPEPDQTANQFHLTPFAEMETEQLAGITIPSSDRASDPAFGLEKNFSLLELAQTPLPNEVKQAPTIPPAIDPVPGLINPPPEVPLPAEPLPQLPPPEELLRPDQPMDVPPELPGEVPAVIFVEQFEVIGSTVFDSAVLAEVARRAVAPNEADPPEPDGTNILVNRELTFAELLQARSAITQYYTDRSYVTSGAFIPPQTLTGKVVQIQILEGSLEEIVVEGTDRLRPSYVADRLAIAGRTPLNVNRLLEGLQLLQLDPLIENLSAELEAGARPGTSLLQVQVTEADTFSINLGLDNNRSPSVGSFRRQVEFVQANLLGIGDGLSVGYTNTDGSNGLDASYTIPINPRNGTIRLAFGTTGSDVIEPPFDELNIDARSRYYEITYRQPVFQSPTEEFTLGLISSHQFSSTQLEEEPFALSPGANAEGETRVTALRFFQEWTKRSSRQVLAARSQFSVGFDFLDATVNQGDLPDGRFFSWRGQGQLVRLLARDLLFLVRSDIQLSPDNLLPLEQFGLGGQNSVRGYRQDFLLTDNGVLVSAEVRVPVLRIPELDGLLQVVPFIDAGITWNNQTPDPEDNTLAGVGLGLLLRLGDRFSARLDWGIPLVDVNARERTWQESGVYFTINYSAF
jgi:hemolysin activation/secretion protein